MRSVVEGEPPGTVTLPTDWVKAVLFTPSLAAIENESPALPLSLKPAGKPPMSVTVTWVFSPVRLLVNCSLAPGSETWRLALMFSTPTLPPPASVMPMRKSATTALRESFASMPEAFTVTQSEVVPSA